MKLDAHWDIQNHPYQHPEESILLETGEIIPLAEKMQHNDVIYTYHPIEKTLSRIVIWGIDANTVCVNVQGTMGSYSKDVPKSELSELLNNFKDLATTPQTYGLINDN